MGVVTTTEIPSGVIFGPLHVAKPEDATPAPNGEGREGREGREVPEGRGIGSDGRGVGSDGRGAGSGPTPSSDPVSHVGVSIKDRRSEDEEINEVRLNTSTKAG